MTKGAALLLRGVPFAVSNGGVFGLGIIDGGAAFAAAWSTSDSNFIVGGVGEGTLALLSHCPKGVFGDAGLGLSEASLSPLTSSSSPPDTGAFASGELRGGRVLALPRLLLVEIGDGDGVWEGDGSVGVGCWRGVCSVDGDPGGVVLRVLEDGPGSGSGLEKNVGWRLIRGFSAFGVLEGERDFGKGTAVGSASAGVGKLFSSSSDSRASCSSSSSCTSPCSSSSSSSSSPSSSGSSSCASPSESVPERNSSICCSPSPPSKATASSSSSSSPPRGTSTNDDDEEDKLLNELSAETT